MYLGETAQELAARMGIVVSPANPNASTASKSPAIAVVGSSGAYVPPKKSGLPWATIALVGGAVVLGWLLLRRKPAQTQTVFATNGRRRSRR